VLNRPNSEAEFQKEERARLRSEYPKLSDYLDRVGANVTLNFGSHVVRDKDDNDYWHDQVRIKVDKNGEINVEPGYMLRDEIDLAAFEPDENERAEIAAEVTTKPFPRAIPFCEDDIARNMTGIDPDELYPYHEPSGDLFTMIQWRRENEEGESYWLTYTLWSDNVWRKMEPPLLPLFGLERQFGKDHQKYARARIMIHEGAKVPRRVYEMLKKGGHPLHEELDRYVHFGWPGGVNRVRSVDWSPIKKLDSGYHVTLACDNDVGGINAATEISRILQSRSLTALKFDDRFPSTFDFADAWPTKHKGWWQGKHYRGPRLDDFLFPATWATKATKNPKDKNKPIWKITDRFAAEWLWVESQDAFVNRQQPNVLRKRAAFNSRVRSFSDIEDTARLFDRSEAQKCDGLAYEPGEPSGVITVGGERLVNLYRPSEIKPIKGDPRPFIRFMLHLAPNRKERRFVLRWITTLVARPWVKMSVANLLVSERQGVGKTTLGEILARLVGLHNTSFPSEKEIIESGFTSWIRNKRLVVINEIYPGRSKSSRKMYDVLKDKITDPHIDVNEKYLKPHTISNHANFLAFSNSMQALHLDDADRRWFVPEVTEDPRNKAYWDGFYAWWKNGDGLGVIFAWLHKLAENPAFVIDAGEHAPSSDAKKEVVEESMSDAERIAFELGEHVAALNKPDKEQPDKKLEKIVLAVDDVRGFAAACLQSHREDPRLASPLAIRRALVRAGLREPKLARGETRRRFPIAALGGRTSYVVANFEIAPGTKWDGIKGSYRNADVVALM
jgi:hypothetical protein